MVAHGGVRLQAVIGTNFFLMELARITKKYASKPQQEFQEVAQHLLELIQAWGEIYGSLGEKNKFPYFVKTYYELRQDPSLIFPAQTNFARGPNLNNQVHTSEDDAFISDMHNQSQQLNMDGRPSSITPPRTDGAGPAYPPPQISPNAQGTQQPASISPPLQHGLGSNYNMNNGFSAAYPASLPSQPPYRQQFTFEEAFEVAAAQSSGITIDQRTIEENKRILAEIANARSKQFETYTVLDYQTTSTSTTRRPSSSAEPYSSPHPSKPAPEPVMSPSELQSTVKESLTLVLEMILASTDVAELKTNDIASEFAEKLKSLQPKFSDVAEKALADGGNVSQLFVIFALLSYLSFCRVSNRFSV